MIFCNIKLLKFMTALIASVTRVTVKMISQKITFLSTMMDQTDNIKALRDTLHEARVSNGEHVENLLQTALCGSEPCGTVEKYEEFNTVTFEGQSLKEKHNSVYPKLTSVRRIMIDILLDEIEDYMPQSEVQHYSVFNPKSWPLDERKDFHYPVFHLTGIMKKMGVASSKFETTISQWREMVKQIKASREEWDKYREADPIHFWYHYMKNEKVPTNVKDMVHRVLSIPIGSSDCERAFSILFHIRSKRRNKLGEDTLENMLRIRLNGPKTINQFASLEYAKAWALSNNMLTDYPGGFKKDQPEPLLGEDEEEKKTLLDGSTLF